MSIRNRGEGKTESGRHVEKVIQFFLFSKYLKPLTFHSTLPLPSHSQSKNNNNNNKKQQQQQNFNYMEFKHSADNHN